MPTPIPDDADRRPLFGGTKPWIVTEWIVQDDIVRHGRSISCMIPSPEYTSVLFSGILDTTTLGGAGFASQRTTEERIWDLAPYAGIELVVSAPPQNDSTTVKTFTLVLKDVVPAVYIDQATGWLREESTLSYEATFKATDGTANGDEQIIFLPWSNFKATYRGRERDGERELDLGGIRRFSVMARSFFDNQSGPFKLGLVSVAAVKGRREKAGFVDEYDMFDEDEDGDGDGDDGVERREVGNGESESPPGWWGCRVM
ncbi:complex I intermediate-associated protein 30-domain-containing protein [Morchella snyderi]|nr:complex I intermediate-associated protein 30-domain-containing protein [Morchella snyderi]